VKDLRVTIQSWSDCQESDITNSNKQCITTTVQLLCTSTCVIWHHS